MKTFWKSFQKTAVGAVACGLLVLGAPHAMADEKPQLVGRVIDVDGPRLKTNRLKESKWYQAYPSMDTYLKERMLADDKTTATVEFAAGGRAVISPGTQVEVISPRKLQIVSGTAWLKFDKDRLNKEEFQIQTSGGVMGIEGTEFIVKTDEATGKTELVVVEGAVRVENGQGKELVKGGDRADFGRQAVKVANYAAYGTPESAIRDAAFAGMDEDTRRVLRPVVNRALWYVPGRYRFLRGTGFWRARGFARDIIAIGRNPVRGTANAVGNRVGGTGGSVIRAAGGMFKSKPKVPVTAIAAAGNTPKFTWEEGGKPQDFTVVLSTDSEGQDVLWYGKTEGRKRELVYPQYGPPLTAGQSYYLFVTPMDKKGQPYVHKGKSMANSGSFVAAGHTPRYYDVKGATAFGSGSTPEVKWQELKEKEDTNTYRVFIKNEAGDVVWAEETQDMNYKYPSTARALPAGTYTAVVKAYDSNGLKMGESKASSFTTTGWDAMGVEDAPPRKVDSTTQSNLELKLEELLAFIR